MCCRVRRLVGIGTRVARYLSVIGTIRPQLIALLDTRETFRTQVKTEDVAPAIIIAESNDFPPETTKPVLRETRRAMQRRDPGTKAISSQQ